MKSSTKLIVILSSVFVLGYISGLIVFNNVPDEYLRKLTKIIPHLIIIGASIFWIYTFIKWAKKVSS